MIRTRDGLRLDVVTWGEGPPVLCLPGLTRHARDFSFLAAARPGLRLVGLTARGRKGSDRGDPATYTVPQEAEDVLAAMDQLGLERAGMIGTSRGGLVTMMLAHRAPERIAAAVLNDIGPVIEPEGLQAIAGYIGQDPPEADYDAAAARFAARPGWDVPPARWRAHAENLFDNGPEGLTVNYDPRLADGFSAAAPEPLWGLFDALAGIPTAVIRGASSDLLSAETVAEMARRHPGLVTAEVPGRGHVPFLDEPAALAAIDAVIPW